MAKVTPATPVCGAPLPSTNVPENFIQRGTAGVGAFCEVGGACVNCPQDRTEVMSTSAQTNKFRRPKVNIFTASFRKSRRRGSAYIDRGIFIEIADDASSGMRKSLDYRGNKGQTKVPRGLTGVSLGFSLATISLIGRGRTTTERSTSAKDAGSTG